MLLRLGLYLLIFSHLSQYSIKYTNKQLWQLTVIEYLLCTRHCSKHFTFTNSFNLHNTFWCGISVMAERRRIELFAQGQRADRVRIQTQEVFLESLCSKLLSYVYQLLCRMISASVFRAKSLCDLTRWILYVQETRAPHPEPPSAGLCPTYHTFPLHFHWPTNNT